MIHIEQFSKRKIAIKGIGKLFFEHGFPIPMSINRLEKEGVVVSILHVADECLKNGWSPKTTLTKLIDDFADSGEKLDVEQLSKFCNSNYEDQREMIFNYLFGSKEEALEHFR